MPTVNQGDPGALSASRRIHGRRACPSSIPHSLSCDKSAIRVHKREIRRLNAVIWHLVQVLFTKHISKFFVDQMAFWDICHSQIRIRFSICIQPEIFSNAIEV